MENTIKFNAWLIIISFILTRLLYIIVRSLRRKLPPGPIGLPIVGYLPFITKFPQFTFAKLAQKYGEVISVRLGSELAIILNGANSIREALGKPEFLNRPPNGPFALRNNTSPFFGTDLNIWKKQRKFIMQTMKEIGMGKLKIKCHIQEEICHLIKTIRSYNGKPITLNSIMCPSVSNNFTSMLFGLRYDYDHPVRKELDQNRLKNATAISHTSVGMFFPWFRYIPFLMRSFNLEALLRRSQRTKDIISENINRCKENLDEKNIKCFADHYLTAMESQKENFSGVDFSEENLVDVSSDLLAAGSAPVNDTLLWAISIMTAFPDVQEKVQKEIMDVLGTHRLPELQDQTTLPYTYAVILEVMRWKTVAPLNAIRYTTADTKVGGYFIPKDTIVIANFYGAHHNHNYWKEPELFIPERFLNEEKNSIIKHSHFIPFSVGKRKCPGEMMSYMEIFLYFVSIMQKFDVKLPHGEKHNFEAELGAVYRLKPYNICLIPKD